MLPPWFVCLLGGLFAGCGGRFAQAPREEPHGLVHIRVVHPKGDRAYEAEGALDSQPPVRLRGDMRVRLSPGRHFIDLSVTGRRYALGNEVVYYSNMGACVDPACVIRLPKREERFTLVERDRITCTRSLAFEVAPNSEQVALLLLADDNTCTACVVPGGRAGRCPSL